MTFDADKLRSFIERYDNSDVVMRPDARYLTDRYLWNNRAAILAMAEGRKAWSEAVTAIMARCEALEDEASNELVKAESEHAQGYWRGQKRTAKSIRRELHDLTRAALSAPALDGEKGE